MHMVHAFISCHISHRMLSKHKSYLLAGHPCTLAARQRTCKLHQTVQALLVLAEVTSPVPINYQVLIMDTAVIAQRLLQRLYSLVVRGVASVVPVVGQSDDDLETVFACGCDRSVQASKERLIILAWGCLQPHTLLRCKAKEAHDVEIVVHCASIHSVSICAQGLRMRWRLCRDALACVCTTGRLVVHDADGKDANNPKCQMHFVLLYRYGCG